LLKVFGLKPFSYYSYFKHGSKKMLKFPIPERQEINLEFKIKVFVGSKIWHFNKFLFVSKFPKIWVVTVLDAGAHGGSADRPMAGCLVVHAKDLV
jgi:hypothetical protein